MYLYLSSSSCEEYFPENDAVRFRTRLPKTIRLAEKRYQIALLDIKFPKFSDKQAVATVTINVDICGESYNGEGYGNILQKLYSDVVDKEQKKRGIKNFVFSFDPARYVPVNTDYLDVIEVYIKRDDGKEISLASGTSECTLHLMEK